MSLAEDSGGAVFETVPTFHPTLAEMRDFDAYLLKLHQEHHCERIGLTKIVPPADWEWRPTLEQAGVMRVRSPIEQCVTGRSGAFNVCNVVKPDLSVAEYAALAREREDTTASASSTTSASDLFQLERRFWKSLTTTARPPLYGSDVEGTLFGDADVAFNVNRLDCCLKRLGVRIPGVTNPMMYVGMWRSFFPFHTEDVNMFSISVMHVGKPKFWYGVPPEHAPRVENLARSTWPAEARECGELMRHKTMLFSPTRLEKAGIPFCRAVQREREIIVTWPACFHGGFNSGLNVAEAVNFCPRSLVDLFLKAARLAGFCKCRPDSVVINVEWLAQRLAGAGEAPEGGEEEPQHQQDQQHQQPQQGWIQCEACSKWRKLPADDGGCAVPTDDAAWTCSMNAWDAARASCDVAEEEDSAAVYPPREQLRAKPLKTRAGERLFLLMDGDVWVEVRAESIVDGFVRLHAPNSASKDDAWVDLRSVRVARAPPKPRKQKKAQPSPAAAAAAAAGAAPKRVKQHESVVAPDEAAACGLAALAQLDVTSSSSSSSSSAAAAASAAAASSSSLAKAVAQRRRDSTRELITRHADHVRAIFSAQPAREPCLQCVQSAKHQWQLPAGWGKFPGVHGLRTTEQAFEVIFKSVIISQKLLGLPRTTFRDPRDASEVHAKLVAYFAEQAGGGAQEEDGEDGGEEE